MQKKEKMQKKTQVHNCIVLKEFSKRKEICTQKIFLSFINKKTKTQVLLVRVNNIFFL